MASQTTYTCDFCGRDMDPREFKINLRLETYTPGSAKRFDLVHHEGDCCKDCDQDLNTRLNEALRECKAKGKKP